MSLLEPVYFQSSPFKDFWVDASQLKTHPAKKALIFQQSLAFSFNGANEQEYFVSLSSSYLYFNHGPDTVYAAKIKWLLVQSFSEEAAAGAVKYGFSITYREKEYDFYVKTAEILNTWMDFFSHVLVMDDFEERYVILKLIDSGQFGKVSLCRDLITGEEFAVKVIKRSKLVYKKALNQLFNEVKIMKALNHPNIVKLHKVFQDPVSVLILMEYVPYGNLYQRVQKKKKFAEKDVIIFARALFELLVFLSLRKIVHQDLKLENILMCSKGNDSEFKLADFGLACYLDKAVKGRSGSPGYMAPEILSMGKCAGNSDVFSAGVVIYVLLTGTSPFLAKNVDEVVKRNAQCMVKYPDKVFRNISDLAKAFLEEILNGDPKSRPHALEASGHEWLWTQRSKDTRSTTQLECNTPKIKFVKVSS